MRSWNLSTKNTHGTQWRSPSAKHTDRICETGRWTRPILIFNLITSTSPAVSTCLHLDTRPTIQMKPLSPSRHLPNLLHTTTRLYIGKYRMGPNSRRTITVYPYLDCCPTTDRRYGDSSDNSTDLFMPLQSVF